MLATVELQELGEYMGRMKPAWYYQRRATQQAARQQHYLTYVPPATTTVTQQPREMRYYRSLFRKIGTDHVYFRASVSEAALGKVTTVAAGLVDDATFNAISTPPPVFPLKGSGIKPTKIDWYLGDATPTAQTTTWGSRWIKYYSGAGTQSHYTMPFSRPTGAFTADDLRAAFRTLFSGTSGTTLLGAANGRANFTLERDVLSADT